MADDGIRDVLSALPAHAGIMVPETMRAISLTTVTEAGADAANVEAWVKEHGGWTRRPPPHLGGGETIFVVPLEALGA